MPEPIRDEILARIQALRLDRVADSDQRSEAAQ